jgi:hypothetical protein
MFPIRRGIGQIIRKAEIEDEQKAQDDGKKEDAFEKEDRSAPRLT